MEPMKRRTTAPPHPLDSVLGDQSEELEKDVRRVMKALEGRDKLLRAARQQGSPEDVTSDVAFVLAALGHRALKRKP